MAQCSCEKEALSSASHESGILRRETLAIMYKETSILIRARDTGPSAWTTAAQPASELQHYCESNC